MREKTSAAPPAFLVVMGVSGCGKSTVAALLAKRLGWPFIEGDDLHPSANIEKMRAGRPLDDIDRQPWLEAVAAKIERSRAAGVSAVISCSALRRRYRDIVIAGHDDVRFVFLRGDRGMLARRLAERRGHFMPASLLESQFLALEEPLPAEQAIVVDAALPPDELVEIIASAAAQRPQGAEYHPATK